MADKDLRAWRSRCLDDQSVSSVFSIYCEYYDHELLHLNANRTDKLMSSSSIVSATHTLQSDVPSIEEKLQALRNLKRILEASDGTMDIYTKRGISQLILDNVLKIIMREDRAVNPFVKQLIRVELYSLLTQLLESQALFGSEIISNLHKL
eukprot:gene37265-45243_t